GKYPKIESRRAAERRGSQALAGSDSRNHPRRDRPRRKRGDRMLGFERILSQGTVDRRASEVCISKSWHCFDSKTIEKPHWPLYESKSDSKPIRYSRRTQGNVAGGCPRAAGCDCSMDP